MKKVIFTTHAAIIAALYVILTLFANALGLANFAIQLRFSEGLTILPLFTPAAVPGLYIGCLISNLLTGCAVWDIIFGPIATLIGAIGTRLLRKKHPLIGTLPPIVANTLIIPYILTYTYRFKGSIPYFMVTVGVGEILSCGVLGYLVWMSLRKYAKLIFHH